MQALAADPRVISAARVGAVLPAEGGLAMLEDPDRFRWSVRVAMQHVLSKDEEARAKAVAAKRRQTVRSGRSSRSSRRRRG